MRFDIPNRVTGAVQFTAEIACTDIAPKSIKIGLAVRWAMKARVHLTGADLNGADLKYADLRRADLRGADLRRADLKGAALPRKLADVVLAGADLTDTNLILVDLAGADLTGANLKNANLWYANLAAANLAGANLAAVVAGVNFAGANLAEACLRGANLRQANLADADLSGADLAYADLAGANLAGANLRGADLARANLAGANLAGANLVARNLDLQGSLRISPEEIPVIADIDAAILAALDAGGKLDLAPQDDATRNRAGWAVHLAGQKGQALKDKVGQAMAGALIYRASRPGKRAPWLYAPTEEAMEDIRNCAAEQTGQPDPGPMIVTLAAHRTAASEYRAACDSYDAMLAAATKPGSADCAAAEVRIQWAAEVMLTAEKKLERMALPMPAGIPDLKRYAERD